MLPATDSPIPGQYGKHHRPGRHHYQPHKWIGLFGLSEFDNRRRHGIRYRGSCSTDVGNSRGGSGLAVGTARWIANISLQTGDNVIIVTANAAAAPCPRPRSR